MGRERVESYLEVHTASQNKCTLLIASKYYKFSECYRSALQINGFHGLCIRRAIIHELQGLQLYVTHRSYRVRVCHAYNICKPETKCRSWVLNLFLKRKDMNSES